MSANRSSGTPHDRSKDEWVVVFPASELHRHVPGVGLFNEVDCQDDLLATCFPLPRSEAEGRNDVIQLVSAFVVTVNDNVLSYRRTRRATDKRLAGAPSILFGGHLGPNDLSPLLSIFDPENGACLIERELNEELSFPRRPRFRYAGIVYDDSMQVSRQHLGIVYQVIVRSDEFCVREPGRLYRVAWQNLASIRANPVEYESWSRLVLESAALHDVPALA